MSITKVQGFLAQGIAAGIKKNGQADLALIYSHNKCAAAAAYTTNKIQAAPIKVTKEHLEDGFLQAVIINSGNANACTGEQGYAAAKIMCESVAKELKIESNMVGVASTGVIGVELPVNKIKDTVPQLVRNLTRDGGEAAAIAIMTTDTFSKEIFIQKKIGGSLVSIGGMAKGSGMIHPNMATMLAFLTTDANIEPHLLHLALKKTVDVSFNLVSVDGDTSTNDMAIIMANGKSGNNPILEEGEDFKAFCGLLNEACISLAKMMARDGEGATKLLEVKVINAPTYADAKKAVLAIIKSSLVKTALYGEDANWGRIIAALGYSGCAFIPEKTDISLVSSAGEIQTAKKGAGLAFDEDKARLILQEKEVTFIIDLHDGTENATAWGCDLTYDYIKINASYRN